MSAKTLFVSEATYVPGSGGLQRGHMSCRATIPHTTGKRQCFTVRMKKGGGRDGLSSPRLGDAYGSGL